MPTTMVSNSIYMFFSKKKNHICYILTRSKETHILTIRSKQTLVNQNSLSSCETGPDNPAFILYTDSTLYYI